MGVMGAAVPSEDDGKAPLRKEAGVWLKCRREEVGLSQRQLAEAVDVTYYTFVSQIEAGRGRIPLERYGVWADALKMDSREFVKRMMFYYEPTAFKILFGNDRSKSKK